MVIVTAVPPHVRNIFAVACSATIPWMYAFTTVLVIGCSAREVRATNR
jgi:hypothetical protein